MTTASGSASPASSAPKREMGILPTGEEPEVSIDGAFGPRLAAFWIDFIVALVCAIAIAKSFDKDQGILQAVTLVACYFCYFFLPEALWGRTLGKFVTGVVVVRFDGRRCSWGQALIRTLFRVIEVNPLIGALPAALAIVGTRYRQRIGDKVAKTLVVRTDQLA